LNDMSTPSTHLHRSLLANAAITAAVALALAGCAVAPSMPLDQPLMPALRQALEAPMAATTAVAQPAHTANAPAAAPDPLTTSLPANRAERRFSLTLAGATPELLFMALLNDTPLSVAVDPAVKGPMSVTLKDVTLREALDLLRELHQLEYKVIGRHIVVLPAAMQTRLFAVDYPSFSRNGRSDLRVVSGSITGVSSNGGASSGNTSGNNNAGNNSGSGALASSESSHVSTAVRNDLWAEVEASIKLMVGDKEGRQVIVSPQTGNILVRALPKEIRAVQDYLDAVRINTQRQVMLEAKVVEVQLRDSERSGINWAAFKNGLSTRATVGLLNPGSALATTGAINSSLVNITPGEAVVAAASNTSSLLGLAFQTSNFASVLEFLATQGNTQVLSSPRIATMNNQKAVLKVGTDDFFVTSISTTTTAVGNSTATTPNISVMPFFSGISLDVTPNVNAEGFITLHIHPAVSNVTERAKVLNLGTQGTYSLPLASSDINETDAVVRARDGQIIAIGGLMRQASTYTDSGLPGAEGQPWRKALGGQTTKLTEKRELVILLKPTVIDPSREDDPRRDPLNRLLEWTDQQPAAALNPAARPAPTPAAATMPAAKPAATAPVAAPAPTRPMAVAAVAPPAPALVPPTRATDPTRLATASRTSTAPATPAYHGLAEPPRGTASATAWTPPGGGGASLAKAPHSLPPAAPTAARAPRPLY
jgi:MSHA biogenesis protein MshL